MIWIFQIVIKKSLINGLVNCLEEHYSWKDIECLCTSESEATKALQDLIDEQMWPEDMVLHLGKHMLNIINHCIH